MSRLELMNLLYTIYVWLKGCAAMKLDGKQIAAIVLAVLLVLISWTQLDETVSAVSYWWHINHVASNEYVVPNWWTQYTIASALFTPVWLVCTGAALLFVRWRPILVIIALSTFLDSGIMKWPTSAVCFGPPVGPNEPLVWTEHLLGLEAGVGLESQGGAIRADSPGV